MKVEEVMTRDPQVIGPHESLRRAAELMDENGVGALPVCDGDRLVGMITDRDIVVRATAAGCPPELTRVAEVMTDEVRWATIEDDIRAVALLMEDLDVHRLPVLDLEKRLVGLVSREQIAEAGNQEPEISGQESDLSLLPSGF